MIVSIRIETDIKALEKKLQVEEQQIQRALPNVVHKVTEFARDQWVKMVNTSLSIDSARLYLTGMRGGDEGISGEGEGLHQGLQEIEDFREDNMSLVALVGKLPNMLEQGFDPFSIADVMLQSPNIKEGKEGPYIDVPFRHKSPQKTNRNDPRSMPRGVYSDMQKAIKHAEQIGSSVARGRKYSTKRRPHHTTSIHSGMTTPTQKPAGGRTYRTFRRISKASLTPRIVTEGDRATEIIPWMHPGYKGIQAVHRVKALVDNVAPQMVAKFLEEFLEEKYEE